VIVSVTRSSGRIARLAAGGISVLAPSRRHDLSRIAFIAMIGGTIATLMGACVVGVLM
jgi:nucleoside permease NupC